MPANRCTLWRRASSRLCSGCMWRTRRRRRRTPGRSWSTASSRGPTGWTPWRRLLRRSTGASPAVWTAPAVVACPAVAEDLAEGVDQPVAGRAVVGDDGHHCSCEIACGPRAGGAGVPEAVDRTPLCAQPVAAGVTGPGDGVDREVRAVCLGVQRAVEGDLACLFGKDAARGVGRPGAVETRMVDVGDPDVSRCPLRLAAARLDPVGVDAAVRRRTAALGGALRAGSGRRDPATAGGRLAVGTG